MYIHRNPNNIIKKIDNLVFEGSKLNFINVPEVININCEMKIIRLNLYGFFKNLRNT